MKLSQSDSTQASIDFLVSQGLLTPWERSKIDDLDQAAYPFRAYVKAAETLHLHIKVENTDELPINAFFDAGARLDHQKHGFVKYRFPGQINAIFSHIKVSQEELLETESNRRARPFLDHIGIDLRAETEENRMLFDRLPAVADTKKYALASQGGAGKPVYCCHVEVAEKHWIYPPKKDEHPGIPLEFAFGALKINPGSSGCDLRPADPQKVDPGSIPACCGTPPTKNAHSASMSESYYQRRDLGRFGEIGRSNPVIANAFFDYYGKVMEDDRLTKREKALIGLAVAHALRCPYCIDSLSSNCLDQGISEAEMMEAIHVAGALSAGVALVHSTQTLAHVDARTH